MKKNQLIALLFVTAVSISACRKDAKTPSTDSEAKSQTQSKNAASTSAVTDVFGIKHINNSASPSKLWTSQHWSTGGQRSLVGDQKDPFDPTGWSTPRGDINLFTITGGGILRMGGVQPRIYIQSTTAKPVFFRDTEMTCYFKRIGTDGPWNAGLLMGTRAGVNGHGGNNCLATTYYFGMRYDGSWVFYKEVVHPDGTNGSSGRAFTTGVMPSNYWYGVKFLAYNIPGTNHVKLEGYIDYRSNGVASAQAWSKVAEITDNGNWTAPVGSCGYASNYIITQGNGTPFIRNTGIAEAQYKMFSVREITSTRAPL